MVAEDGYLRGVTDRPPLHADGTARYSRRSVLRTAAVTAAAATWAPSARSSALLPTPASPTVSPTSAPTADPMPVVVPRSAWGARPPGEPVRYFDTVRLAVVHHTAGGNAYGPGDVPGILRSIQNFHMDGQGWFDIAYHFLVDAFGTIWEGRFGGIDESFQGTHLKGLNAESFGVALIGDFTAAAPSGAAVAAATELIAWKLKRYDVAADGLTTVWPSGDGNELHPSGTPATLPAIIGHGEGGPSACPGARLGALLPSIRSGASARQGAYRVKPRTRAAVSEGPLARNADGRLEVFGIGPAGDLRHLWQRGPVGTGWSELWSLAGSFEPAEPQVIANLDGRLEVFLAGADGFVRHCWQDPNAGSRWSDFPAIGPRSATVPAVARNHDGRLELFAVDDAGALWHAWQLAAGSGWSEPAALGSGFAAAPGVGAALDDRLVLAAVRAGGELVMMAQSSPGRSWSSTVHVGSGMAGRPAVAANADGRLAVFAIGTDGRLHHAVQSGYLVAAPTALGAAPLVGDPCVTTNPDGRLEVFALGADGRLWHSYQQQPGGSWSGVDAIGGDRLAGSPSVIANDDGRLEVFIRDETGTCWHTWQLAPSSGWSGLHPLTGGLAPAAPRG